MKERDAGKGTGTKVSKREIAAYNQLRKAGVSPQTAAELIGRSKSWAYGFEQRNRLDAVPSIRDRRADYMEKPSPDLSEACGLCLCVLGGDRDTAVGMLERFGPTFAFEVCKVAIYLASLRADDLQREYGDQLFEGEVLQPEDVFETIPFVMDRYLRGESLEENPVLPSKVPELDHDRYREWLYEGEAGPHGNWEERDAARANGNGTI